MSVAVEHLTYDWPNADAPVRAVRRWKAKLSAMIGEPASNPSVRFELALTPHLTVSACAGAAGERDEPNPLACRGAAMSTRLAAWSHAVAF